MVRGPSKHVPEAIVDLDTDQGAAAGCKKLTTPRHEQVRGLGSVRQVQFWTPQNSDLAGFRNFKFPSYASMLHMVFAGSLDRKKLGKSVVFFHVHANWTQVPRKI